MRDLLVRLWKDESGQGMVEYGLILALVAVAAIAALRFLGQGVDGIFGEVTQTLQESGVGGN